jgi:L-amino acid N-acyltransferase YncA
MESLEMNLEIQPMNEEDWPVIAEIYQLGIETGIATFQTDVPSFSEWDREHIKKCRFVAKIDHTVAGWIALASVSSCCVYAGVAEVSIYIAPSCRGKGVGKALLNHLVTESEKAGFWTLQSGIIEDNLPSLKLHEKCGFRQIGLREKIGRDSNGKWRSTVLMERRSKIVGID